MRFLRGVLCAVVLVFGLALPAAAHDQLIASTPENGAALADAPTQIELEYSAEIMAATPMIVIQDDAGNTIHETTPTVDGRFVRTPFPELPGGAYQLNWSVVSSDGHRIEGTIAFELATGSTPTVTSDPSMNAEPATTQDAVRPTAEATATGGTAPEADAPTSLAPGATPDVGSGLPRAIVGVAGIAAIGAVAALAVRRWKTAREDPTP